MSTSQFLAKRESGFHHNNNYYKYVIIIMDFCISPVKMSETIDDPYAYTNLTDNVLHQIWMSTRPELGKV